MSFIPNTDADRARMLEVIGVASPAELFHDVPKEHRFPLLDLPPALSEQEVLGELEALSQLNAQGGATPSFLGAGAYRHFIPAVVDALVSRSEFATAYTPYQPEISQGTLQAIFEYQSMIARLTGMEVSNASHYDGATSAAEAVIMSLNVAQKERPRVLLSCGVNPQYRAVVRTYTQGMGLTFGGDENLANGIDELESMCDESTACVMVQYPDFLGRIPQPGRLLELAGKVHACGALLVAVVNPIALGLLVQPGEWGADVVAGEGQSLGNHLSFGGPYLGFFAFRRDHIRRSSGRIAGETADHDGRRSYVFTLSTREQHIRREKATSNICTNQSLNALAAAVYMASLGPRGLRQVAELCWHKAHYAASAIGEVSGYSVAREQFFDEFVVHCPASVRRINEKLFQKHRIIGGYDLSADYPEMKNAMLVCCTEVNTKENIDRFVGALEDCRHA
jgi:glycine dehydrogenase subunit 1